MLNTLLRVGLLGVCLLGLSVDFSLAIEEDITPDEPQTLSVSGEVLTYRGIFTAQDAEVLIILTELNAGDVIYADADGFGFVNTYLTLIDDATGTILIEDDNGGIGFDAALQYEITKAGTYLLQMNNIGSEGGFLLHVGVNTPQIFQEDTASSRDDFFNVEFDPFDCDDVRAGTRPELSGSERTREADTFVVHYTRSGLDRTTEGWVDELVIALQRSLDIQFEELGWALPPSDCGEGGDTRLDVYVMDIENFGAAGIATSEVLVGNNPNTPVEEYYATYSFLRIDNDMSFVADTDEAFDLMRTTAAHEVHHNIQFGYDSNDRFFGFYEAGATWLETLVYPNLSISGADVTPVFNTPDACYGSFDGFGSGDVRPYSEWLVIDSFSRDLGRDSYQFIWEYLAANEGLGAFYDALEELDTTPEEVILRAGIRNLLLDYALADNFTSRVRIETTVDDFGLVAPTRNGVQQLSVDYIELTEQRIYTIDLLDGDALEVYLVGVDANSDTARLYEIGTTGTVDTSPYSDAFIIVLNTARHLDTDICVYTNWILQLSDGSTASEVMQPTDEIWNATNFEHSSGGLHQGN